MKWDLLLTELQKPEYQNLSSVEISDILNTLTVTRDCACPISLLNAKADSTGLSVKLKILDRKSDDQLGSLFTSEAAGTVRQLIIAALGPFEAKYASIDFTDDAIRTTYYQVVDGLRTFNIIETDDAVTELKAMGTEVVSFATVIDWSGPITSGDVETAISETF